MPGAVTSHERPCRVLTARHVWLLVVLNDPDRFHLVADVIDRVPGLQATAAYAKQSIRDKLIEHRQYIERYGEDMPQVREWTWSAS